jgi:hypothetical protein
MGNPNRARSMIEYLLARGQNNFLRRRQRFELSHNLDPEATIPAQTNWLVRLAIYASTCVG